MPLFTLVNAFVYEAFSTRPLSFSVIPAPLFLSPARA